MAQNGFDQGSAGCHQSDRSTHCANNCGFFGSASTLNMCPKCYSEHISKTMHSAAAPPVTRSPSSSSTSPAAPVTPSSASNSSRLTDTPVTPAVRSLESGPSGGAATSSSSAAAAAVAPTVPIEATAASPASPTGPSTVCSALPGSRPVNRCGVCSRRVGLTGFKCRCDGLFCTTHRYSDRHTCTFDYKSAGRDAIARANPVVVADKVQRF